MQHSHGNRFVQRALRAALQPKLAVNQPGDRHEQEADRLADVALQRKCTCGTGAGECERCAGSMQRKEEGGAPAASLGPPAPVTAPASVERALNSPGAPLPERTRAEMESRLGGDFGGVVVHDDSAAHRSARDVSARAYTVGRHVVFGRGQFRTGTTEGRRLLAHELVHVLQQTGHQSAAPARVQRAADAPADSWGTFGDVALQGALMGSPFPEPLRGAAASSIRGFVAELRSQYSSNSDAIWGFLKEMTSFGTLKSVTWGLFGGLVAGIISPITGLFDMLVFADRLRVLVGRLAADAANRFAALVEDARQVAEEIGAAVGAVREELSKLKGNPIQLLVGLVTDKGPSQLESIANKAGHDAVLSMAGAVAKRFSGAKTEQEPAKQSAEESPLARADAKLEQLKESLFSTPWSKIGYDIGYAIGFAAINVLMLVFSGGIGNLLTKLGSALGELGGLLGQAGKLVAVVGKVITFVEEAINAVMNIAMKPLQPVLRALEPHLQKLAQFLRKLLGVAEKETAEAAAAAAKATAAATKPKSAAPHLAPPEAHVPPGHAPAPGERAPAAARPAAESRPEAAAHPKPAAHEPHLDPNEAKALEQTRNLEHLDPAMIDKELEAASKVKGGPSTEPGYVEERVLPNGHTWRKTANGNWCRFSPKPGVCVGPSALDEFLARGGVVTKGPTHPPSEPQYTAVPKESEHLPERTDEIRDRPNMDLRKVQAKRPSAVLADALEAKGRPRPPGYEAHHIVPEGMESAERALEILRLEGIGVNTAENGAWLRGWRPGLRTEGFGSHLGIHTPEYVAGVTELLEQAHKTGTVKEVLQSIGEILEAGKINEILRMGKKALKGG
jgi:hypothetical protein